MRALLGLSLAALAPAMASQWRGAATLDRLVREAIEEGQTPGAVLLVGQGERILHHRAYGDRSLLPERRPMLEDTIFDCASLTKVVAAAPAVMLLVEEGRLRLDERVTKYLPRFRDGDSPITVRQLLTHTSGLRPDLDIEPAWSGYRTGVELAYRETPVAKPDERFIYSDINFILIAEIVRQLSGAPFDEFARQRIFEPLGMRDTMFRPSAALRERIAPTEKLRDGTLLHGVVHDPSTRYMGGVSGHAGMFSTAADLARFCRMMLGRGRLDGARLLSPLSVAAMTRVQTPPNLPARGLAWDIASPFASNRGDLFPPGSYGHTGYTGTSLWIDPSTGGYVVLLANRVHPRDTGSLVGLRARTASAAAAALDDPAETATASARRAPARPAARVLTGLDALVRDGFAPLSGKRVGLITNRTGIDRRGRRGVDLMAEAENVELAAIFSPEHGLEADLDQEKIGDSTYRGIPVFSLYRGERRRPAPESLRGLDALVFDIQDIGARFYTYLTTMAYAMEEAARAGIPFYVLDRPNPIGGVRVEGPVLDSALRSFVGYYEMPVRHGMTAGELARLFNAERAIGADLRVVEMEGWRRGMWFDETGLPWVDPSPNIRSLTQALLYPAAALLEYSPDYSVGRGTDAPFEFVGADWMRANELAEELNRAGIPGMRFYAETRTPTASNFAGKTIPGLRLSVADRDAVSTARLGLELAAALHRLHPGRVGFERNEKLIGSRRAVEALRRGDPAPSIEDAERRRAEPFLAVRQRYLLYGE